MEISIVIPVYNVEDYIEECMISILNQTIDSKEIIMIDDGSTDRSLEIINKVKERYKKERILVISRDNKGLSATRNEGIEISKGEYIYFIDSDDFIFRNNALEILLNKAKETKSDIVRGEYQNYYAKDNQQQIYFNEELEMNGREYLIYKANNKKILTVVWNSLYKREFLIENNLKFYEGIYHEDDEFHFRSCYLANKIVEFKYIFLNYRQREGSIMDMKKLNEGKKDKIVKSLLKIVNSLFKFFNDKGEDNKVLTRVIIDYYFNVFSKLNELDVKNKTKHFKLIKENKLNEKIINKLEKGKKKRKLILALNFPRFYYNQRYFFRRKKIIYIFK